MWQSGVLPQCQPHKGNKQDLQTDPNSCFSDLWDSLNLLNSITLAIKADVGKSKINSAKISSGDWTRDLLWFAFDPLLLSKLGIVCKTETFMIIYFKKGVKQISSKDSRLHDVIGGVLEFFLNVFTEFLLHWFIRFPGFAEIIESNESSSPFRKNFIVSAKYSQL